MVPIAVEISMLLWHYQNRFVVSYFTVFVSGHDGPLDVLPNVRRIISIEINDLFFDFALNWRIT